MLKAEDISRGFAGQPLFDNVSWFVGDHDRIGLAGPNGSGKSTWLKMLAGEEATDSGRFVQPKGQRIGYLPQFSFQLGTGTVMEEARSAFRELLRMEAEMADLQGGMESGDPETASAAVARYTDLEHRFGNLGGYQIDRNIDRVLKGLGFVLEDYEKKIAELSGGWQMRVALAKLLLEKPDLLLLDEPTNHLDIEARSWLAQFLREYPGAFVLVSHDRHFLDGTVTRISDVMARSLVDYRGNYSSFLVQREERYEQALKAWERQQEEIKRMERFVERFKAKASKATQAQSRVKALEKIVRLERPVSFNQQVHFRFPQPKRSGRFAIEVKGIAKSYDDLEVFRDIDLIIERGQKVALVGPNGAGKSTLMRILAGIEPFQKGERKMGHQVESDYFAQDAADQLPGDQTILELAMDRAPTEFVPSVRGLLGAFLFSGSTVDKKVSVLSGGERNRLALSLMLMMPHTLFLLDEPTNHLDLSAKDVLLEALRQFEGTVVFVSHDHYFLSALATRVVEVGGGTLYDHPGTYESFLVRQRERGAGGASQSGAGGAVGGRTPGPAVGKPSGSVKASASNGTTPGRTVNVAKLAEIEKKISETEEKKEQLESLLADPDVYKDKKKSEFYTEEYRAVSSQLDGLMEDWAEIAE